MSLHDGFFLSVEHIDMVSEKAQIKINKAPRNAIRYRPDIDGLRAIAVIAVVLFHAFPDKFSNGFAGVDVFFVISGFLITKIICQSLDDGSFSFSYFYARRVQRLLPSLLFVLISFWAISRSLLLPEDFILLGKHLWGAATFTSNFVFLLENDYFDVANVYKPLLHLWSLAVEEQYYLIWPVFLSCIFIFGSKRFLKLFVLSSILMSIFFIFVMHEYRDALFYMLPARVCELSLGGFLGVVRPRQHNYFYEFIKHKICYASLLFLLMLTLFLPFGLAIEKPLIVTFSCVLTALLIASGMVGPANRFLSNKYFVYLGLISYPLYLWHWPLISLCYLTLPGELNTELAMPSMASLMLAISGAALLAVFSREVIERLVNRLISYFSSKSYPSKAVLISGLLTLTLVGIVGFLSQKGVFLTEHQIRAVEFKQQALKRGPDYANGSCFIGNPQFSIDHFDHNLCFSKRGTAGPNVFMWGDSYASTYFYSMSKVVNHMGGSFSAIAAASCPPIISFFHEGMPNCQNINGFVLNHIENHDYSTLVLSANWLGSLIRIPNFEAQDLEDTVKQLESVGVTNIVVVGQAPWWRLRLYRLLQHNYILKGYRLPRHADQWLQNGLFFEDKKLKKIFSKYEKVHYLSVLDHICGQNSCPVVIDLNGRMGELTTFDDGHPSFNQAHVTVKLIEKFIK
jgi:peptidoglycan/LPS O-acetylase OafA/YrhL